MLGSLDLCAKHALFSQLYVGAGGVGVGDSADLAE